MEKQLVFSSDFTLHAVDCPQIDKPKEIIRDTVLLGVPFIAKCICFACSNKVNTVFAERLQSYN